MKTIPANKIKRMCAIGIRINDVLFFYQHFKIAKLIIGFQICGSLDISFAIRRMFHQLAIFIAVTFWRSDRTKTFYNKQAIIFIIKFQLVNGTPWYDQVISIFKSDLSISRFLKFRYLHE